jgi:hypothetical protein
MINEILKHLPASPQMALPSLSRWLNKLTLLMVLGLLLSVTTTKAVTMSSEHPGKKITPAQASWLDPNLTLTNSGGSIFAAGPVFDSPPTPQENSSVCLKRGEFYSATIQAHSPDPNTKVQIISADVSVGNPTFSTPLPTPSGNTSSTFFALFAIGFGPYHISATAQDSKGLISKTGWDIIVNDPPVFTSTPNPTKVFTGQQYTYNIKAFDLDLFSGDTLAFTAKTLPSWLTLTKTGKTKAVLTGTPGPADVGSNHVVLQLSDRYGKCYAPVLQDFYIIVAPCPLIVRITENPNMQTFCPGTKVTLTANTFPVASAYSWSTGAHTKSISTVANGTDTYTVKASNKTCSTTASATIHGIDLIPPTARCKNITVKLDSNGIANITAAQVNNGSTDNCSIKSMTVSPHTFSCSNLGETQPVTLTVTDSSGNSSQCSSLVTVKDQIAPKAKCKDITVQLDSSGKATISAAQIDNGSTDNCGIRYMTVSPRTFGCDNMGINTVTLTVIDASGNSSTCTSKVTVKNSFLPVAHCKDITVNLDSSGTVIIAPSQINNGSTSTCGIRSMKVSPCAFTCENIGKNTVTLTVIGASGDSSKCISTVTVRDQMAPIARCKDITAYLDSTGKVQITAAQVNRGSTDNCGVRSMTVQPNSFSCANTGRNQVILTVTDANGNAAKCTSTVTIKDNTPPQAHCKDIHAYLDQTGKAQIKASDVDNGSTDNCSIRSMEVRPNNFNCSNVGIQTVELIVTDASGNRGKCTARVKVLDTIPPTVSCKPARLSLIGGKAYLKPADINYSSTDNCGIASVSISPDTFTCANIGAQTVVLTVTDVNGNHASCTTVVNIDGSKPGLSITSKFPFDSTFVTQLHPTDTGHIYLGYGLQSLNLTATATGAAPFKYLWSGTGLSCDTCPNTVFKPVVPGTYSLSVRATNLFGCDTTASLTICVMDIRVPGSDNMVYVCHDPRSYDPDDSVRTVALNVYVAAILLDFFPGDKLGSCGQTCGSAVRLAAKEPNLQAKKGLEVIAYPNPFTEGFHLKIQTIGNGPITLHLYSISGQLIETLSNLTNTEELSLGHDLADGMYFLEVQQAGFRKVVKVKKMK